MFDFSWFWTFLALPPDQMILKIFFTVGWIPFAVVFLYGAKEIWMDYITGKWASKQKFILLAIDIPRDNAQSPLAVENIFTYLASTHGSFNLIETYWEGKFILSISLEIVSIDGYTQFLVHAPVHTRDIVETAFYSQYPEAEITEVNDYVEMMPKNFPDDQYDLWGTEFNFAQKWVYPIKTYESFMHQMGRPEEHFKDPMALLMDLCSSLKKGEQLWWQNVITAEGFEWTKECDKEIDKILGKKPPTKDNILDKLSNMFLGFLDVFSETVFPLWGDVDDKKTETVSEEKKMIDLKPDEKEKIEAINAKKSKTAFKLKSRFVYIAEKEIMNKPKVVNGFVGFMKQFTDLNLNNLKPEIPKTGVSAAYFFVEKRLNSRKNKLIRNYRSRSSLSGVTPGVINIEELATIWHFPIDAVVKAPLIQKAAGRKAEPPTSLPFVTESSDAEIGHVDSSGEDIFASLHDEVEDVAKLDKEELINDRPANKTDKGLVDDDIFTEEEPQKKGAPPSNLPFG